MTKIAIDGPAGAGKSTISKRVSAQLGYIYIDTGAMYRAVGLYAIRNGVDTNDAQGVTKLLESIDIDIRHIGEEQHVFLNGEDVNSFIRTPEISIAASNVSRIGEVRREMVTLQRRLAGNHNVVMDGRDIATHVLPDAEVKIFLTASAQARAKRRYIELTQKGEQVSYEDVLSDMEMRDHNDSTRECSPLKIDDTATVIDTSDLTLEESIDAVLNHIRESAK